MIPMDYRDTLRAPLLEVASRQRKLMSAQQALAKLEAASAAGVAPGPLRPKAPVIQLTTEFKGTEKGSSAEEDLKKAHSEYSAQLLNVNLRAKRDEVARFEELLSPQHLFSELGPIVKSRGDHVIASSKLPRIVEGPNGELSVGEWVASAPAISIASQVAQDVIVYAYRIIAILKAGERLAAEKRSRKNEIKTAADVEMADGTTPDAASIAKLVEQAVSKRLGSSASSSKVSSDNFNYWIDTEVYFRSVLEIEQQEQQGEEDSAEKTKGNAPAGRSHSQWRADLLTTSSRKDISRAACEEGGEKRRQDERTQTERQGAWKGQGKGKGKGVDTVATPSFVFRTDNPTLYPDWLLTVPFTDAVKYVIMNTPINVVKASRFRNNIHLSTGVNVPIEIQFSLSVGMNFMFPTKRESKLISEAYNDFERRLRWRLLFAFKGEDNSNYDPDYDLRIPSKKEPPRFPAYIEQGFANGRRFVRDTIAHIPEQITSAPFKSLMPDIRLVQKFLTDNDYVVSGTDKNLGIAVSKRTWIIERSIEILSDKKNYIPLHPATVLAILNEQHNTMEGISHFAECNLPGDQLGPYLRSLVTSNGNERLKKIPMFYGIPKIHKEPVKFRPIIPCHSAVQNPAAKYCSKMLKPIIKSAPTIIHGSKDLAIKLSKIHIDTNRQWYIATGDVVAYYPNINLTLAMNIAEGYYCTQFGLPIDATPELHAELLSANPEAANLIRMFSACLRVGNMNLITQFQDKYYRQIRGLAMGVSDSPDLANLYGMFFETECGILDDPNVIFYGRYIDDCLGVVYASSEQEALDILAKVQFAECTIEWSASSQSQPFLDMLLFKDENNSLQHKPYRKARNHQERIPFISSHPLDVKRGTYLGELSRLSTLCTRMSDYKEAVASLETLYIMRGYPTALVKSWSKNNMTKKWNQRLSVEERAAEEVLVLKSSFNTAWNYFNARELGDTILGHWRTFMEHAEKQDGSMPIALHPGHIGHTSDIEALPEFRTQVGVVGTEPVLMPDARKINVVNRRILVSRKRTRNLFDLTSLWKKTVLSRLEEHAQDNQPANPRLDRSLDLDDDVGPSHWGNRPRPGDLDYTNDRLIAVSQQSKITNFFGEMNIGKKRSAVDPTSVEESGSTLPPQKRQRRDL